MENGQIVRAFRKTGSYVGEITEAGQDVCVVRVLAVLKHPMQGNLHHPREVEVPFFHERKAHAFREQIQVPANMVRPYKGDIPKYEDSLKDAVQNLHDELAAKPDAPFSKRSLEALKVLIPEYELMYGIQWPNIAKS
ncbi:sporulation phosphorelay system protein KapB [Siminovitchia fortis]|uniref:Kinase n=1 Tax=Siminovitchia fortis TaxID=254758 RepID=A0A443IMI1_9BACI|nr:sporulation phosphorelay system protein KapB [Siminovitchia fortis]RWR06339.1 kinase [Siminovitchia fortis]WHY82154.1 sporulation phosphorelay system protein KapB [Siminovitchia fortis]